MKKKFSSALQVAASLTTASLFGHANAAVVITDPSFETTFSRSFSVTSGTWMGFDNGSATVAFSTASPRNGSQHLSLDMAGTTNSFAGIVQDVNVTAGDELVYSGWHQGVDTAVGQVEIRIEWLDASKLEIGRTANYTPGVNASYDMFSMAATAPVGSSFARTVYALQSFSGSANASVEADDFSLVMVPEPTSVSLLGIGAASLFLRRKRRG